jgi:putative CocE/NonD family hydrolase
MLASVASFAAEEPSSLNATNTSVVKIPMRDGIHLNATVFTPKNQRAPEPCVFVLTPYDGWRSHAYKVSGIPSAVHGLPFITVDSRGRGSSEGSGSSRPFFQEAKDGYDIVEWLAKQPYCNGKVAMWGLSYMGYDQWATAKELPPHLATIVPIAAAHPGVDLPMRDNLFEPFMLYWLICEVAPDRVPQSCDDPAFWTALNLRLIESGQPLEEFDRLAGYPSSVGQEWMSHPQPDAYWDAYNPTPEQYAKLRIPILTITGSYDDDQPGALSFYQEHMRYGNADAKARHYLVIGPWDHGHTVGPAAEFGGIKVGPASLLDVKKLHLEWYTWTMKDGPKPEFLKNRVAYYVMGAEKWRYAETLESVTATHGVYFLQSTENPTDVFHSGSLTSRQPADGHPDHYVYDPHDISDAELRSAMGTKSWVDQRLVYAASGKQLVYHTASFEKDTEISGFFKLSAWIYIDCPDTDLYVSLFDIGLDGSSIRLSTDAIRARYREGLRTPKLIQTHAPLRYDFNHFTFVSRQIKQGHRLRLVIAPEGQLVEEDFEEKNYNSGGTVTKESMRDARPVTVTLYHDHSHPSALYVPLGQPESVAEPTAPTSSLVTQ